MVGTERGTIIEGVGDDVFFGLTTFLVGLAPFVALLYVWFRRCDLYQTIHPSNAENVQTTRQQLQQNHRDNNAQTPRREREVTCPICLGDAQFAIQTNCGHTYCGNCIATYWRHGRWMGAVRCPVCRQVVTVLLVTFTGEEHAMNSEEKAEVMGHVYDYNRRFSGEPRPWLDYLRDAPTLLRHLISEFFSASGLLVMFRVRIVVLFIFALLYFISPLDIIPEAAFGILGFIDDFFVLMLLGVYVSIIYRRFIQARAEARATL